MSNKDDDNEINVTFEKIDDEEEDIEEEQEAPDAVQIVEEHIVGVDPSSVMQEQDDMNAEEEEEDILTDASEDDVEQQLKEQSVKIEKLDQRLNNLDVRNEEIKDQFERLNDLQ